MLEAISPSATLISALGLIILILWERPWMKKLSFTTIIQGPLVAVLTGILLKIYFDGKAGWSSQEITCVHSSNGRVSMVSLVNLRHRISVLFSILLFILLELPWP